MDLGRLREEAAVAGHAVQLLTRLPVRVVYRADRMAASPRWYPAVGGLVGVAVAVVLVIGAWIWPLGLAVLVSTAAGLILTGALHEDGLADMCDGLGGGATAERALEIMRDSRLGSYGAAALGLALGAKVLSLASLPGPMMAALALVAGHAVSRFAVLWVMARSTYVRRAGAGAGVAQAVRPGGMVFALATALVFAAPLVGVAPGAVPFGVIGAGFGLFTVRMWFERRLGGHTGDCLGAVQQASEIGFYLGLLAWL